MHIMSILCSMVDAVSSGSCPILFKFLTLNVAICTVCFLKQQKLLKCKYLNNVAEKSSG